MTKDYSYNVTLEVGINNESLLLLTQQFKDRYVIEHSDFDLTIQELIKDAIQGVETFTNHVLGFKTIEVYASPCKGLFELPELPAIDIVSSDGQAIVRVGKAHIRLDSDEPVTVTYNAGYNYWNIPNDIRGAIFEYVNTLFLMEDSKVTGIQKEDILDSILKKRLMKYKMDADCTALI